MEGPVAKIVIIDDNEIVRKLLGIMLRDHGHYVIEADDGKEGLEAIQAVLPDVIVTDFYMPHMTGAEMIKNLRALRTSVSDTPVIGLAGSVDAERQLAEAGVFCYLPKPLQEAQLTEAVTRALEARKALFLAP